MIEFVSGGDLMFHMQRQRRLPEEHARFYSAEISLALNFLHEKGKNTNRQMDRQTDRQTGRIMLFSLSIIKWDMICNINGYKKVILKLHF